MNIYKTTPDESISSFNNFVTQSEAQDKEQQIAEYSRRLDQYRRSLVANVGAVGIEASIGRND